MTPDLIEDVSRAIMSAAGMTPDRHKMAQAAIAAIEASGTHQVVPEIPPLGVIRAAKASLSSDDRLTYMGLEEILMAYRAVLSALKQEAASDE